MSTFAARPLVSRWRSLMGRRPTVIAPELDRRPPRPAPAPAPRRTAHVAAMARIHAASA